MALESGGGVVQSIFGHDVDGVRRCATFKPHFLVLDELAVGVRLTGGLIFCDRAVQKMSEIGARLRVGGVRARRGGGAHENEDGGEAKRIVRRVR